MGLNTGEFTRAAATRVGALPRSQPRRDTILLAERDIAASETRQWGWLPGLSVIGALGLLLVAVADTGARFSSSWAEPCFWLGLLVLYAPIAWRLLAGDTSARESVGLVTILGVGLYLVKVLQSPLGYTLHDEFLHWRTLDDIMATGHLFTDNPLLPLSALYPGLETVTAAIASNTGLSFFTSGLLVVGTARLVFILALYLGYRQLSGSERVAGIACLIYMANPNFVFFDAVYSYESLALTFVGVALFGLMRRQHIDKQGRLGLILLVVIAMTALVMTHHITAYALAGFLFFWLVADYYAVYYKGHGMQDTYGPAWVAPLAILLCLLWLVLMASETVGYLGPHIWGAITEMIGMIRNEHAGRQLFTSSTGQVSALWEQLTGYAAVGLVMLGIPLGLWQVWRRRLGNSTLSFALAAGAVLYPASLAFRLTSEGWEASNRSSEFLFLAIGFVLALWIGESWLTKQGGMPLKPWRAVLTTVALAVMFTGGVISGWPPAWRLPGPFVIVPSTAGGSRDISPKAEAAATWVRDKLGSNNYIAADATNLLLLGSLGNQHVETTLSGGVNSGWILYSPQIDLDRESLMRKGQVRYVLVDHRLTTAPELARSYFPATQIDGPLAKFDYLRNINRIFDDGDIAIYDVGAISRAP